MPRVTIVVPAYNAERYLKPTLERATTQTFRDIDIVVIDDGSSDATGRIAESFGHPVRVVTQANAGMSASRNRGIASSDSEYFALLDSDDVWHPQKIERQLEALAQRPDAGLCFTGFVWWHGEDLSGWFNEARSDAQDPRFCGWIYHELILDNWALPSSWLMRRSMWEQTGPFPGDNQQTDDWEYVVRASYQLPFVKLRDDFVLYRQVSSSLSKRIPTANVGELMRESLLGRFGLASLDGTQVDRRALRRQRYKGWRNFADTQLCPRGLQARAAHLRSAVGHRAQLGRDPSEPGHGFPSPLVGPVMKSGLVARFLNAKHVRGIGRYLQEVRSACSVPLRSTSCLPF